MVIIVNIFLTDVRKHKKVGTVASDASYLLNDRSDNSQRGDG